MMTRFAPAAPYNRTTLDSIRQMVTQRWSVEGIAAALGWTDKELQSRADRHSIKLYYPQATVAAALPSISAAAVQQRSGVLIEPGVRRRRFRATGPKGVKNPRNKYIAISLSTAAAAVLKKQGDAAEKSIAALVGFTVDYAARNGKFPELFKEALAELEREKA